MTSGPPDPDGERPVAAAALGRPSSSERRSPDDRRHLDPHVAGRGEQGVAADGLDRERTVAGEAAGDLDVAAGRRAARASRSVAARSSTSPETVRAVSGLPAVAMMSRSPETASMTIAPLTARRVMSPDVVR